MANNQQSQIYSSSINFKIYISLYISIYPLRISTRLRSREKNLLYCSFHSSRNAIKAEPVQKFEIAGAKWVTSHGETRVCVYILQEDGSHSAFSPPPVLCSAARKRSADDGEPGHEEFALMGTVIELARTLGFHKFTIDAR